MESEIKTKTVERLIAPLVHLVTSLHADYCPPGRTGLDKNRVLTQLNESLENFVSIGIDYVDK